MEKIKKLLSEAGISQDAINAIVESMTEFQHSTKAQYDAEFKKRLLEARKVCIEQFEKEKAGLSRKVEIFLEAKQASIEKIAQKQVAIGEGKALKTLREAKAILEGVTFEGNTPTEIQAMRDELQALRLRDRQLTEALDKSNQKATRSNKIAMQLLQRVRMSESKKPETAPVTESKVTAAPAKIDSVRKPQAPATTRQPITETVARPAAPVVGGDSEVASIAKQMDDVPAF